MSIGVVKSPQTMHPVQGKELILWSSNIPLNIDLLLNALKAERLISIGKIQDHCPNVYCFVAYHLLFD